MTLMYKWGKNIYTLEQLIDNNNIKEIWNSIIIDELNYWESFCLDDLITQASYEFQNELYELGYNIYFVNIDNKKNDYNKLLDILRR